MELLTDVFAIAGWAGAGYLLPLFTRRILKLWVYSLGALSFGLIAASLVLG